MSTREKIVTSAVTLFIHQGIARTTTKEIASRASVSEGSIYRYFPSKDELAWQIFDEYHQQLAQQLMQATDKQTTLLNKVEALVECFLTLADNDWLMFKYYLTSQHTHMSKVKATSITPYNVVISIIEELMASNEIQQNNVSVIAAMVMGAVHQIGINKIYGRIDGSLVAHKRLVSNTIINMLATNV